MFTFARDLTVTHLKKWSKFAGERHRFCGLVLDQSVSAPQGIVFSIRNPWKKPYSFSFSRSLRDANIVQFIHFDLSKNNNERKWTWADNEVKQDYILES